METENYMYLYTTIAVFPSTNLTTNATVILPVASIYILYDSLVSLSYASKYSSCGLLMYFGDEVIVIPKIQLKFQDIM